MSSKPLIYLRKNISTKMHVYKKIPLLLLCLLLKCTAKAYMSSVLPLPLIMSQGTHLRLFVNLKQLIHVVYRVYLLFVQQENDLLLRLHVKMKAKVSGTMQPLYLVEMKIEKKKYWRNSNRNSCIYKYL